MICDRYLCVWRWWPRLIDAVRRHLDVVCIELGDTVTAAIHDENNSGGAAALLHITQRWPIDHRHPRQLTFEAAS